MEDRIAQKPGRFMITPEDESAMPFYAKVIAADNATVQGTRLDKETLLSDMVADALNLDRKTATPTQAFMALIQHISKVRTKRNILCNRSNVLFPDSTSMYQQIAIQLSDRMENYDMLLFRIYADLGTSVGSGSDKGIALFTAAENGRRVAAMSIHRPKGGGCVSADAYWSAWLKTPSGYFITSDKSGDIFDATSVSSINSLKFSGNHVYLAENDYMSADTPTTVEVVGYKLYPEVTV